MRRRIWGLQIRGSRICRGAEAGEEGAEVSGMAGSGGEEGMEAAGV